MGDALLWGVSSGAAALAVLLFVAGWFSPSTMTWLLKPWLFMWGSRAVRKLPVRTALDRTYTYEGMVIVVGAGAAGLAAARVLHNNKIRYRILEATERSGGRVKADNTFADFPIDLGAEWIHNLPGILSVMGGVESAATQPELIPWRLNEVFEWNGQRLAKNSAIENELAFRFFPEYRFKRSTWYEFVAVLFAKSVETRIQYSSPVVEVDYSKDKVQLTTANGETFVADRVIITASVGVLRSGHISFVPALSARRQDALKTVQFLPGFKLVLKFTEKFYPDLINWPLGNDADGGRGWFDIAFQKDAQSNVLGFLATGTGTEPYYAMASEVEIVRAVIKELDLMYDNRASHTFTGEYLLEDWGRKEFTQGSWVEGFRIDKSTLTEINAPLEDKVYFAGEAHDVYQQMGLPGAVLSGLEVVDRVLSSSMHESSA